MPISANFHGGQTSNGWGALQPSLRKWQHVAKTHSLQTVGQLCFGPALLDKSRSCAFSANFHGGQTSNGWGALQPSLRKWQHVAKTHSLQTVGQLCFGPALLDKSRSCEFSANFHGGQTSNGWGALQPSLRKWQHVAKTHSLQTVGQLWASSFGQVTVLCALQKSQHVQINNPIPLILNTP